MAHSPTICYLDAMFNRRSPFAALKRLSLIFLFAAISAVPASSWAQKGKIKIAVQGPLSGEQSAFGEHIKLGAQLAVEEAVKLSKRWATIWYWCPTTTRRSRRSASPTRAI